MTTSTSTLDRNSLRDAAYAVIGLGDELLTSLRQRLESSDAIPTDLMDRFRSAYDDLSREIESRSDSLSRSFDKERAELAETYQELVERGRRLQTRIADTREAREAEDAVEQATASVKGATTSVRRSTDTATAKIKAAITSTRKALEAIGDASEAAADQVGAKDRSVLQNKTKAELYDLATRRDIDGRSQMSKDELVDALATA